MRKKLRLVSGGQQPPDNGTGKNPAEKSAQLRDIANSWENQKIRSLGPRGLISTLIAATASILAYLVSFLLEDFFDFAPGNVIVFVVAAVAFVAVRYIAIKRSTLPRTFAEIFDTQLLAYDPIDTAAYRVFQHQVRLIGLNDQNVSDWLTCERQALAKLSNRSNPHQRFADRPM